MQRTNPLDRQRHDRPVVLLATVAAFALCLFGCGGGGGGSGDGGTVAPSSAGFVITDASGAPVMNATVYLVPAAAVDDAAYTGTDILNGAFEDADEPLEDQIRLFGSTYPQAVTDAQGRALIANVPAGNYFWFAQPDAADTEHLPGGNESRFARDWAGFVGQNSSIVLASQPSDLATYTGSSTCLVCHSSKEAQKTHAHRLGFARPGNLGTLQDDSRYPDFQDGWNAFLPAATYTSGTKIYFSNYDPTRGFDKFKTKLGSAPAGETVYAIAYLWIDNADQKYKITLENVINTADPGSPRTMEVPLTYGGAIYKQRNLVTVPGRRGLYPFLQIQTEGVETRADRTRKVFRDYHLDWFWNATTNTFKDPPLNKNFEADCTACHSTGFQRFQDTTTGEYLSDAVDDLSGEYDIDGDGTPDEINLGCEVCHGPGSEHVGWASNPANAGRGARFIVNQSRLSPARDALTCGKCHDRPVGNGPIANEEPINPQGRMARPGISRAQWLAEYTTRKGPANSDYWADDIHSKSHHQQYSDFIKSTMYRNDRILTTCRDCHASHGEGSFENHLVEDPNLVNSFLCQRCHAIDQITHLVEKTGETHGGNSTRCVDCHMNKTAKTGSGRFGILLGIPNGTSADNAITYFENDISSHRFLVPRKTHPSVAGIQPASAMPIPFTASCGGLCHNAAALPTTPPPLSAGSGIYAQPVTGSTETNEPDNGSSKDSERK